MDVVILVSYKKSYFKCIRNFEKKSFNIPLSFLFNDVNGLIHLNYIYYINKVRYKLHNIHDS